MFSSSSFQITPDPTADIPLITVEPGVEPALAALAAAPERFELLLACARRAYTPIGVRLADDLSRNWASRNQSPYRPAAESVANAIGRRAAYLLNHSYEWGCTAGAVADSELVEPHQGIVIERTEDRAFIAPQPTAANHWASDPGPKGRPRDKTSLARRDERANCAKAGLDARLAQGTDPRFIHAPRRHGQSRKRASRRPGVGEKRPRYPSSRT